MQKEENPMPAPCGEASHPKANTLDEPDQSHSNPAYSGMAVASLISGIASLALIPAFVFGTLSIIFGVIDIRNARRSGIRVHKMTKAGITLGIIGLILGIVLRIVI